MPNAVAAHRERTELEAEMRARLARLGPEGLANRIDYRDLRGNPQSDAIGQIVQPSMDLIAIFRQRSPKS